MDRHLSGTLISIDWMQSEGIASALILYSRRPDFLSRTAAQELVYLASQPVGQEFFLRPNEFAVVDCISALTDLCKRLR